MRLERRQREPSVASAIKTVCRQLASERTALAGQAPLQRLREKPRRIVQRHFDVRALAAAVASHEQSERRDDRPLRSAEIGDEGARQRGRHDESHLGLIGQIVPSHVLARGPVSDDGHLAEPRVARVQIRPAEAETLQSGGPDRREQEVRGRESFFERHVIRVGLQVEDLHLYAARQIRVPVRGDAGERIAARRLDFDDGSAKIPQRRRRDRTGDVDRQSHDAGSLQRRSHRVRFH